MNSDSREKLLDAIASFRTGMLVTSAGNGSYRARPMALADQTQDDELWFATSNDSPKVAEIEADPNVAVTMQDGNLYISLSGTATVVRDRARIEELWSESWKLWFTGKDDPSLILIHVELTEGEYWDSTGLQGVKFLLQAAKSLISGKPQQEIAGADDDQNQKVAL